MCIQDASETAVSAALYAIFNESYILFLHDKEQRHRELRGCDL